MSKVSRHDTAAASAWVSRNPWPVLMIAVAALCTAAALRFDWLDSASRSGDHGAKAALGTWVFGLIGLYLLVRALRSLLAR